MKSAFEHSGNKLIYHWRESIGSALFITFFAAFWNTITFSAVYALTSGAGFTVNDVPYTSITEAFEQNPIIIIFLIFPAIGLLFAYVALASWINQTVFSWDGMYLTKKTTPLPMNGDFKLSRSSIVKIFVDKTIGARTKPTNPTFTVMARLIDGTEVIIHKTGQNPANAMLLENWIKERLNLLEN